MKKDNQLDSRKVSTTSTTNPFNTFALEDGSFIHL
jgi:hypothetical protein